MQYFRRCLELINILNVCNVIYSQGYIWSLRDSTDIVNPSLHLSIRHLETELSIALWGGLTILLNLFHQACPSLRGSTYVTGVLKLSDNRATFRVLLYTFLVDSVRLYGLI